MPSHVRFGPKATKIIAAQRGARSAINDHRGLIDGFHCKNIHGTHAPVEEAPTTSLAT
jgi:hypothetical protein